MSYFTPRRVDTIFAAVFVTIASGNWQLGMAAYFIICAMRPNDGGMKP